MRVQIAPPTTTGWCRCDICGKDITLASPPHFHDVPDGRGVPLSENVSFTVPVNNTPAPGTFVLAQPDEHPNWPTVASATEAQPIHNYPGPLVQYDRGLVRLWSLTHFEFVSDDILAYQPGNATAFRFTGALGIKLSDALQMEQTAALKIGVTA